jgi:hypothetical protein
MEHEPGNESSMTPDERDKGSDEHEPAVPEGLEDHPDLRKPPIRAGRRERPEKED